MLIVIATYYLLFAVIASSSPALMIESTVSAGFLMLAVAGFKKNLWLVCRRTRRTRNFRFFSSHVHSESGGAGVVARFLSIIRPRRRHLSGCTDGEAYQIRADVSDQRK